MSSARDNQSNPIDRDERVRRIIAQCVGALRSIGEEDVAYRIMRLPRVVELYVRDEAPS
jgi:hypothetical protein